MKSLDEEQLRKAQQLKMVDQLAVGVAHEINNPLTLVIGYARLLLRESPTPEVRQRAETIYEAGLRAESIVRRLLNFSQQQQAGQRMLELNDLVRQTLELVRYQFEAHHLQLVDELEEGLPQVKGHPGQLQQVLLNLMHNSREAILSARDKGRIEVRTRAREGRVVLEVEDDGPGIAEEIRERVFEPFFTTHGVGQGTGLGLSVCRGIAAEHGGLLRGEPRPAGACLVLELPAEAGRKGGNSTEWEMEISGAAAEERKETDSDGA